jgi:hypothetical protein
VQDSDEAREERIKKYIDREEEEAMERIAMELAKID